MYSFMSNNLIDKGLGANPMTYNWGALKIDLGKKDGNLRDYGDCGESYTFYRTGGSPVSVEIDIDGLNRRCVRNISEIGFKPRQITVREGTEEEMKGCNGWYLGSPKEEILVKRRYCRPGTQNDEKSTSYEEEFFFLHKNYPFFVTGDVSSQIYHLAEDIVCHEYGHEIFSDAYIDILKGLLEEHVLPKYWADSDIRTIMAGMHISDIDEGFARWINYAAVGHEHPGELLDLFLFSSEEIRSSGEVAYHDRKTVGEFYLVLKNKSDEHSIEHVVENFPIIAAEFVRAKYEEKEREREESARDWASRTFTRSDK
jgi:hypothetical protein